MSSINSDVIVINLLKKGTCAVFTCTYTSARACLCTGTPRPGFAQTFPSLCLQEFTLHAIFFLLGQKETVSLWKDSEIRQTDNATVARTSIHSVCPTCVLPVSTRYSSSDAYPNSSLSSRKDLNQ